MKVLLVQDIHKNVKEIVVENISFIESKTHYSKIYMNSGHKIVVSKYEYNRIRIEMENLK